MRTGLGKGLLLFLLAALFNCSDVPSGLKRTAVDSTDVSGRF